MDRRNEKTKKLLRNCLINLMNKKEIRKITITDIAKMADINRGTFYLHYLDIYDMVEKIEEQSINDINKIIEHNKESILRNEYFPLLIEIANFIKNDMKLYKVLLSNNGDIAFVGKLKKAMLETFFNNSSSFSYIEDPFILYSLASFIVSGGIGVFEDWLNNNCKYPAEKIISSLEGYFLKRI